MWLIDIIKTYYSNSFVR